MPSSPVGRDGYNAADLPGVGVPPPAERRGIVSYPDSEPIRKSTPGPAYGGDAGAGSSGRPAPVPTQVKQFNHESERKGFTMEEELREARRFHGRPEPSGLTAMQKAGKRTLWQKVAGAIFRD